MAKEVTVLGIDGDFLRGVRLDLAGEDPVRAHAEAWSLAMSPETGDSADSASGEGAVATEEATAEVVAQDRPLVRALRAACSVFGTHEFALSLPLSHFLVKTVQLPVEAKDDLEGAAQLALDGISPFPDEMLTPGVEIVAENERELTAVIAALPQATSEELSEAMQLAKVRVLRTDALVLGWLRSLQNEISPQPLARRIVLFKLGALWDLVILDHGVLSFLRGIGSVQDAAELVREVTLSVLQLDDGLGNANEVVVCAAEELPSDWLSALETFGPVRLVTLSDEFAGVEGAALRIVDSSLPSADNPTLDVTPEVWQEARLESRFRRKVLLWLSIAGGVWLLLMGGLFGYDVVYDMMTAHQKSLQKDKVHVEKLRNVTALRDRVTLIQRYADHAHGALEVLKVVTDCLPGSQDMSFRQFQYRRDESVRVNGTAGEREDIRSFTENLEAAAFEDADENLFPKVQQSGGESQTKKGIRFSIECFFKADEEESSSSGRGR